jgi:hypothetical protein
MSGEKQVLASYWLIRKSASEETPLLLRQTCASA